MQRRIIFNANDLLRLFTHYTEGVVPLDAELREFMLHPYFQRMLGMWVRSDEWTDQTPSDKPEDAARGAITPIQVRYEGRKTLAVARPTSSEEWKDSVDAPKRQ